MGVEYAIVHDATKEAYELGKGFGWQWQVPDKHDPYPDHPWPPSCRGAVRAVVAEAFEEASDAWLIACTDAVWAFIEAHPGCRMSSDTGDDFWSVNPTGEHVKTWDRVFRQVGTRYDVTAPLQGEGSDG